MSFYPTNIVLLLHKPMDDMKDKDIYFCFHPLSANEQSTPWPLSQRISDTFVGRLSHESNNKKRTINT